MQWWGPEGFTSPLAKMDFREGGTSLVCMSSPEYGDQYSTWQYRKIVPMQRIEYIHNLADKDGNKIDPTSIGMPADFPQDLCNLVTFKDLGDGKTDLGERLAVVYHRVCAVGRHRNAAQRRRFVLQPRLPRDHHALGQSVCAGCV